MFYRIGAAGACCQVVTVRTVALTRTYRSVRRRLSRRPSGTEVKPLSQEAIAGLGYSSQLGQDLLLDRLVFAERRGGVVVDVGAHDGVTFSNSVFFERSRGWTAICIEPNPKVFNELRQNRPQAHCVQRAVGSEAGTAEFTAITGYGEMLSGLTGKYGSRQSKRVDREIDRHGGSKTTISVEISRLDSLLRDAAIRKVDLLTIDVEGGEASVLDSLSLAEFGVGAVVVENNYGTRSISSRLTKQGYQLFARIGWDEVHVPRPFRLDTSGE